MHNIIYAKYICAICEQQMVHMWDYGSKTEWWNYTNPAVYRKFFSLGQALMMNYSVWPQASDFPSRSERKTLEKIQIYSNLTIDKISGSQSGVCNAYNYQMHVTKHQNDASFDLLEESVDLQKPATWKIQKLLNY